jgi:hypothetical protein
VGGMGEWSVLQEIIRIFRDWKLFSVAIKKDIKNGFKRLKQK